MSQPKTQPTRPPLNLEQAIHLAKAGQKVEACDQLRRIVAEQPVNQAAWLWLSAIALERDEAEAALAQARHINPAHHALPKAKQWFEKRFVTVEAEDDDPPSTAPVFGNVRLTLVRAGAVFILIALSVGLGWFGLNVGAIANQAAPSLAASVEAEEAALYASLKDAWSRKEWPVVITGLERMRRQQPDSDFVKTNLAQAHLQYGLSLRQQGIIEAAKQQFEQATALASEDRRAQQELDLTRRYLAGRAQYQAGAWADAIAALGNIYTLAPDYPNVRDMLFSAYYNWGLALQAADDLAAAQTAFEAAIALRPDLAAPRQQMSALEFAMLPDTPPARPIPSVPLEQRLVIVGIAEQRMHVYEGRKKVFDFIVSTGEPGRETAIGEFEIQNKIDVAYASTWNLDMPHWLGIYWAGPLQNGIHSLPTVRHTGNTLWDGYLGQRVSYGCVILGHEDSATLYDWAEVGTKVKIVPSLVAWSLEDELAER